MRYNANVRFYGINQCGYYKSKHQDPEFGTIEEILSDLGKWIAGKNVERTSTYTPKEKDRILRTFCYDIDTNNLGDHLVTTWNEIASTENGIVSIAGNEPIGEANVSLTDVPENHIPGYATYFWFISKSNRYATIQFSSKQNGKQNLEKYIKNLMSRYSRFCVTDRVSSEKDTDIGHLEESQRIKLGMQGYSKDKKNIEAQHLYPRFESHLYERGSKNISKIKNNLGRIEKVRKKSTLSINANNGTNDASLWGSLLENLGIKQTRSDNKIAKITYDIPNFHPTADQLDEIIRNYLTQSSQDEWDDIGFNLRGDSRTYWFSRALAGGNFTLDAEKENSEIFRGASLHNALTENKHQILSLLE